MNYLKFKQLSFLAFFTFLSFTGFSQQFYLGVQTGYSFATNSGQLSLTNIKATDNTYSEELVRGGFGQGLNTALTLGYAFNDNIGFEIGGSYAFSGGIDTEYDESSDFYTYEGKANMKASMFQLSPRLVFNLNSESKLNPYMKIGATLGLGSKITMTGEEVFRSDFDSDMVEFTIVQNGGMALGFNAALGANYGLTENISIFAEASFLSLSYAPTDREITQYEYNGVDELKELDKSDRETIFVDKLGTSSNTNDNEPSEELKVYQPFSNLGLSIGLKVGF